MSAAMVLPRKRLTIRMLGPLEVALAGRPVALTAGRLQTLLVTLALAAGSDVSIDRLTTALWGEHPPGNARRSVQTYVTRLRNTLGTEFVARSFAGYMLCVDPDEVDALRFVRLLNDASAATDPATERALLVEALALWRGAPFDGVPSAWLAEAQAPRLVERYLAAVERRIDIDIADGRYGELVAQLGQLTAQHPLRESLWVRLLVVLERSGRQAEALERYEAIRVRLADELGVDPGSELQQIHADLLVSRGTPRSNEPDTRTTANRVVPQQLPADVDVFTGRKPVLEALNELLADVTDSDPSGRMVVAITGTAGVGKTALAVHWAHRVAARFPDGQLHVDLRGFHPSGSAMAPGDAVRGFLDALQGPQPRIPATMDAQVGLYRSLLAGKRVLIVLDNARDADQVRPLLPGASGCLVIVTSRNPLPGLIATDGARAVSLDLLTVDESMQLLAHRLGHDRVAAEPEAATEIVERCARLPLALAIAAARAATRPTFPLGVLAAELGDTQGGLAALDGGDAASDMRAVFSWSYRMLRPDAARLFRLLGLHPGPDISAAATASLAGGTTGQMGSLIDELIRTQLITERTPGRYALHDLLRAYAAELARMRESTADQRDALRRMLDHYVYTARAAALQVDTHREPITLSPAQRGVSVEALDSRDHALAWFGTEHRVLLSIVEFAWRNGFAAHTWQLAWALADFLQWRGQWHDRATTQHLALQAGEQLGDRAKQVRAHRGLGHAYMRLCRYDDAHDHLQHALRLAGELDDPGGRARAHLGLSHVFERQGDHTEALGHAQRALALYPPTGDQTNRARALNVVGWCHAQLGDYRATVEHCEQALALHEGLDDRVGEAACWDSLGYAHHHLGNYVQAVRCYQRALDQRRALGHRLGEVSTLAHLGDTHEATGAIDAARHAWQQALSILDQLGEHDTEVVRRKLEHAGATGG